MIEFEGYYKGNLYFDNAASTLALKSVTDEVLGFLSTYGSIHRGSGYNSQVSTESYERARSYIHKCLNGTSEDTVIFTANTTDGINRVCTMLNLTKDDAVIVSDIEHSANMLPYNQYSKLITIDTGKSNIVTANQIESRLQLRKDIKLVALAAANNVTGYIAPFEEIYKVCKRYGVAFLLDCSQYAPHYRMSFNMADILVYSGHKMYAPFGVGVIAGKKSVLGKHGRLEPTGGGNVIYSTSDTTYYKESPYSHEIGTPNGVGAIAIAEAHRVLYEDIDLDCHTKKLVDKMLNIRLNDNYKVYFNDTENKTPVLVFTSKVSLNSEVCEALGERVFLREGAFCSYRLLEKLNPELSLETPVINGSLNPKYSLIRASAGLVNNSNDFALLEQRLNNIVF